MFDTLSNKLGAVFDRLRGRGALSESDVTEALREIRIALLEADVALPAVKQVIADIREQAIGQNVLSSVTPGHMVVKIVNDHLTILLGSQAEPLNISSPGPTIIMMVGLQGSGKTTSSAKLARYLTQREKKKVLLASTDIYRPAAQEQLEILAQQLKIDNLPIVPGEQPLDIAKRGWALAKKSLADVYIIDTAGRLHIDDTLMDELLAIKQGLPVSETLLVADAMTGQDAVNVATSFHEKLSLSGIILTRVDGDARGGAALSMRMVTGCPIKFVGLGERLDQLEVFHPDRIASRILGMGDIVGLVEKAAEVVDQEEAEKLSKKLAKGGFDLNDMAKQLQQVSKLGGMRSVLKLLPGFSGMQEKMQSAGLDDKMVNRMLAMIFSMTPGERANPKILNASRKRRITSGSGTQVHELNRMLKQFQDTNTLMKRLQAGGQNKGKFRQGLKKLFR